MRKWDTQDKGYRHMACRVERKIIGLSPELRLRECGEGQSSKPLKPSLETSPQVFSGEHYKLDSVSHWILRRSVFI